MLSFPFDRPTVAVATAALMAPLSLVATPANKAALEKHFGEFLPASLESCATCHVRAHPKGAETLEDFPHNSFGRRLAALGEGKPLARRLEAVAGQDSDGDGVGNRDEVLAGSAPGDPDSTARPDEDRLAAWATFQERYRWRPFQPVERPEVPEAGGDWVRDPIDAFIAARHGEERLGPNPEASRGTWLRRVTLDLTGLSPTPEERAAFLADESESAHEKVVDRLLDSPTYAERWARHWMDVWRYSDWAGYRDSLRESQRHIWHWRDWIVESLDADKGYDRMAIEMLAADELFPGDREALRATGYLARNFFRDRNQWMDNVVTHTSQGFLGLTVGCAKCHDHMYDPISMRDYYAMRAIFESYHVRTDRVPGELDVMEAGLPRAYDRSLDPSTWMFERGDERRPIKDEAIPPHPPEALGGEFEVEPVDLPRYAEHPGRRPSVRKDLLAAVEQRLADADADLQRAAIEREREALRAEFEVEDLEDADKKGEPEWRAAAKKLVELQRRRGLAKAEWQLESSRAKQASAEAALGKAESKSAQSKAKKKLSDAKKQINEAEKALATAREAMEAEVTTEYEPREQESYPGKSTGRRTAFARWLVDRENPLAARVAVNHIWLRHFGRALVPTVNEFGAHGSEPTHPALLDWLAAEFMESGWSMKQLHRRIVLSATYRMASTPHEEHAAIDPDNVHYWRMPYRRMEGEIVRDNLLHVAGALDRTRGGPDIPHTEAQTSKRRSLYFRHAHEKLVEFVQIFDGPKVTECYRRDSTVQPHQALALANSRLTFDQSEALADELTSAVSDDDRAFVERAYLRILARPPKEEERRLCLEFLEDSERKNLVMVLFNHNEFLTIR